MPTARACILHTQGDILREGQQGQAEGGRGGIKGMWLYLPGSRLEKQVKMVSQHHLVVNFDTLLNEIH